MNRLRITPSAIQHNYQRVSGWVEDHGSSLTVVTKALCGNEDSLRMLLDLGVRSVADSRLENLEVISDITDDVETWYLRPPSCAMLEEVVELADVSLNTELSTIKELDVVARRMGRTHSVVLMIELGDLREGILPGRLVNLYNEVFELRNIRVLGIGANLGCLSGTVPSIDQVMQLILYKELLELKFERKLDLISAGSSILLPFLLEGTVPSSVNHFRVGESILLGTDLLAGGSLRDLREDGFILDAEVLEIKEKSLTPFGETLEEVVPFQVQEDDDEERTPGQRGYRAIVSVGGLDTDVSGLTPVDPDYRIAGASSDVTVLNVGDERDGLSVGDLVSFRTSYSTLVRLMNNHYTEKVVTEDPTPGGGRRCASG